MQNSPFFFECCTWSQELWTRLETILLSTLVRLTFSVRRALTTTNTLVARVHRRELEGAAFSLTFRLYDFVRFVSFRELPQSTNFMLIVFDVDGTLIGGEAQDWDCFDRAIETVVGFAPTQEFFDSLPEITAQAIAEASIRAVNKELGLGLEERIRDEYLRRLRLVHSSDPQAFQPRAGVVEFLSRLRSVPGVGVAIATGDWQATISFKLAASGIDVSGFPIATCSDHRRRTEIIRLAAQRAGQSLSDAIYVGDGVWDLRACRDLGVRFIGTGSRLHLLKQAGAEYTIEVLREQLSPRLHHPPPRSCQCPMTTMKRMLNRLARTNERIRPEGTSSSSSCR
jgi:phosphoglycolate phosphatase-like HAD superfamily hydrolase